MRVIGVMIVALSVAVGAGAARAEGPAAKPRVWAPQQAPAQATQAGQAQPAPMGVGGEVVTEARALPGRSSDESVPAPKRPATAARADMGPRVISEGPATPQNVVKPPAAEQGAVRAPQAASAQGKIPAKAAPARVAPAAPKAADRGGSGPR